jgi:hypothetical protein
VEKRKRPSKQNITEPAIVEKDGSLASMSEETASSILIELKAESGNDQSYNSASYPTCCVQNIIHLT